MDVFISYAREDREHLEACVMHLSPLLRQLKLELWYDAQIVTGAYWESEIGRAMESAVIGVLLVSPSFIKSDFIRAVELPRLERAEEQGKLRFCVVHVRPAAFESIPILMRVQAANNPCSPIASSSLPDRDAAWVQVARNIADAAKARLPALNDAPHVEATLQEAMLARWPGARRALMRCSDARVQQLGGALLSLIEALREPSTRSSRLRDAESELCDAAILCRCARDLLESRLWPLLKAKHLAVRPVVARSPGEDCGRCREFERLRALVPEP